MHLLLEVHGCLEPVHSRDLFMGMNLDAPGLRSLNSQTSAPKRGDSQPPIMVSGRRGKDEVRLVTPNLIKLELKKQRVKQGKTVQLHVKTRNIDKPLLTSWTATNIQYHRKSLQFTRPVALKQRVKNAPSFFHLPRQVPIIL